MAGSWSRLLAARRSAGRARLVHGDVGPRRPHRRQPFPPRPPTCCSRCSIMAALIWTALDLRRLARTGEDRPVAPDRARRWPPSPILFVQLLLGAWVAGLNAGQVATDWPLMQGRFVPDGIDWIHGAGFALTNDPYLHPLPPPLVGVGRGRRAGHLRPEGPRHSRRPPRLDRHPLGLRHPDPARHRHGDERGRASGSPRSTRRSAPCSSPPRRGAHTCMEARR